MTGFHGNGNGISIPRFRFSAAPCQLRAVNAIWLTARIQNSSILKWQRERNRKCLPSHFAFLPLKRTQFYDCLSYWLMVIEHILRPRVPLLTNLFKSLFHPSQSFLPHWDLTGLWLPSWLSTCCPRDGHWTENVVRNVGRRQFSDFNDLRLEGGKKNLLKKGVLGDKLENDHSWENVC